MVAEELGFRVDSIRVNYPDCKAMRLCGGGWTGVRIEFEYESRHFKDHCHRADACNVIVCWRDNWPESERPPNLEVIELQKVIKMLPSSITRAKPFTVV
jgi:hypothetical protein